MEEGVRVIVLDTETTGFDRNKDRITEIGCVELLDFKPTGRMFHSYFYSGVEIPDEVVKLTGITNLFLEDKPLFKDIAPLFIDFISDMKLVAHNASFDCGFIDSELQRAGFNPLGLDRYIDTLHSARKKYPGKRASLDALCDRFNISRSSRSFHGAITDTLLLCDVYRELHQDKLILFTNNSSDTLKYVNHEKFTGIKRVNKSRLTKKQIKDHKEFLFDMEKSSGVKSIWAKYEEKKSI